MAVTCGFFNALEHDRLYDAIQMSSIFDGIIRDGIFSTIGTSMAVTASGTGLVVNVGAGRAWFNHTWILNDTLYPVEAEAAEVVLDRIDALVIEVNQSAEVRDCSIKFVKGTPSSRPVRPTMIHNAEVNQYALAYVSIRAGQTTIFQADITSVIGNDETPFVTGLLQQTSIESIVAQWQDEFYTYFNNFRSTTTSDFNTWMAARVAEYNAWYASMEAEGQADLAEFDSWFQEMKDQLSEDAAGHLQAEIDALELSAEKGSVVIVTTSDDTLINHACTISQGSSERNATFDINRVATFESIPFVGDMHITATNGTMIASKDINIPYFGRYNYDLEFWEATLAISSSSTELYERPITITKGGTTVGTTSFDNTGHATFKVHEPGTYTVTSTTTGGAVFTANVEVTAETSYPVDLGTPIGRTALPTDDIQLWLKCGGEYDVTYTTLAEVLADTELFARLCADSNACDYMARSTTWALAEGSVPAMTSDTTPEGQVIYSAVNSGWGTYKVFTDTGGWVTPLNATPCYFGYKFENPTIINRISLIYTVNNGTVASNISFAIQGSNTGNSDDWTDLGTITVTGTTQSRTSAFCVVNNTTSYTYYRLYTTTALHLNPQYFVLNFLQFYQADITTNSTAMQIVGMFDYCAEALLSDSTWASAIVNSSYADSIIEVKVPTMTSNTTPSGYVASASSIWGSGYEPYRAFDNNASTFWNASGASDYIQIEFPIAVDIKYVTALIQADNKIGTYKIQGSNDGFVSDIHDLTDVLTMTSVNVSTTINDGNAYRYYRFNQLSITGDSSSCAITALQFYGRTKTVEYVPLVPNLTSNTSSQSIGEATGTSRYNDGYDYWQAFSQGITSPQNNGRYGWLPNLSTTPYICAFHFNTPKKVSHIRVARKSNSATTVIKAVGSNDGTNWTDISNTITINSDTTSIQTDWTYPYSDIINITSDTEYSYIGIQVVSSSIAINSGGGYRFEIYSIAEGITIHSAANDTIYYLDGSTPVTVAVTDANGKAVIDTEDLDPGTYTLYSTVAKNPDNLSNAYSKTVKINGNTTEIYLMPITGVGYWFGYESKNITLMAQPYKDDQSSGARSAATITKNTNNIRFSISNAMGSYAIADSILAVGATKIKTVITSSTTLENRGGVCLTNNYVQNFSYIQWNYQKNYSNLTLIQLPITTSGYNKIAGAIWSGSIAHYAIIFDND